jgi:uncharacterized membrane protein
MASKKMKTIVWTTVVAASLLVGAVSVFAFSFSKYEKIKADGATVSLPVARLADGKARFYRIEDGGKQIAFFVVKAPDGSYRTAFDACDVCYKEKKGYDQQGDRMNCKNCNQKFATNRIGPNTSGGCNPSFLPHQVNGTSITISLSDLKAGARFF